MTGKNSRFITPPLRRLKKKKDSFFFPLSEYILTIENLTALQNKYKDLLHIQGKIFTIFTKSYSSFPRASYLHLLISCISPAFAATCPNVDRGSRRWHRVFLAVAVAVAVERSWTGLQDELR